MSMMPNFTFTVTVLSPREPPYGGAGDPSNPFEVSPEMPAQGDVAPPPDR
ncbi:unnamed protein product [Dibothriocephalus latus]|uniref:Uncharacterized protein n=1 Tax=Dibothriocephalus latus TaxID=60516 RepID=A0A3P7L6X4_DIBLA|nr:unnamed protein product [Dibothriocephalus latus]